MSTRRSVRAILCVIGFVPLLTLLLPTQALAGDVGGVTSADNTVGGVTQTADNTVGGVTQTADNTVGGVTQTADNTVGGVTQSADNTVGGVTQSADEAVGRVTQSGTDTVGQVTNVANGTSLGTQVGAPAQPMDGSNEGAASNSMIDRGSNGSGGWRAYDRRMASPTPMNDGQRQWMRYRETHDREPREADPCATNPQLVCLGLLFGLGDFADTATQVLGALVRTGFSVIGLLVIAVALGGIGIAAFAASSDRRIALAVRRTA
jgi:hypothetical protein